jgi:hypothetical protein
MERIMKAARAALAVVALCALSLAASAPAQAHGYYRGGHYSGHSNVHWGFYFGWPYYNSWYYPTYPYSYPYGYGYPYYPYYGGTVVVPSGPTTYVERGDQQAAPERPAQSWWYYCPESKTYYPYVKQCPGGWQKVEPQPPAQ